MQVTKAMAARMYEQGATIRITSHDLDGNLNDSIEWSRRNLHSREVSFTELMTYYKGESLTFHCQAATSAII